MAKALAHCPVCEGSLGITELTCAHCNTRIQSKFDPCRFCRLAPEHLGFLELFLRCEGNLSRVERELGLSYPTVRNKLSAALNALGFGEDSEPGLPEPVAPDNSEGRRQVLEDLAEGRISAEEAALSLRGLP